MSKKIVINEAKLRKMMVPEFNPHPAQRQILDNMKKLTVIEAGRQFGKSFLMGYVLIRELLKPGTKTWIVAPYTYQADIIWNYVYPTCSQYPETFEIRIDQKKITCKQTGSILECKTAENPVGLLGATLTGLVIDEAAEIPKDVWEQRLEPTLTVKRGWCVMISTPLTEENWFHTLYSQAKAGDLEDAIGFHFTSYDNPYQSKEELDKIRNRIPEFRFQQQYLAIPHSDSGLVFKGVDQAVYGELRGPEAGVNRYIVGWDPARARDYSVIVVLDRVTGQVVHFDRSTNLDWDVQQERVLHIAERYNNAKVVMDATGVGDPLMYSLQTKAMQRNSSVFVEPFKISTNKIKVDLIENLAVMIQEWGISYPRIPELLHELKSFRYFETSSGNIRYDHPKGEHDDCVLALALCAWEHKHFPFNKQSISRKQDDKYVRVY